MKLDKKGSRANKVILIDRKLRGKVFITTLGIILVTTTALYLFSSKEDKKTEPKQEQVITISSERIVEEPIQEKEVYEIPIEIIGELGNSNQEQLSEEQKLIEEFSNAYNINSEIAYKIAQERTNNFTDLEYLKTNNIKGTTLSGKERNYQTKEQGLLLFVRSLSQIPSNFGVTKEQLKSEKTYYTEISYENITKRYSEIMDMDPSLVLAIMYNESAVFKSEMFETMNNPGGLRNNGIWWHFETKEAGIIETVITLYNLFYDKDYTISQMGNLYCPEGTDNWISDVSYFYEQIINNPLDFFNEVEDKKIN